MPTFLQGTGTLSLTGNLIPGSYGQIKWL